MAASVDPGDAGVDGQAGEAVSRVTFGTGAAHLVSILRTYGSVSAATVPNVTHVHHCRDRYVYSRSVSVSHTQRWLSFTCTGESVSLVKRPTQTGVVLLTDGLWRTGWRTLEDLGWRTKTQSVRVRTLLSLLI